jgi:prophage regulatory protein
MERMTPQKIIMMRDLTQFTGLKETQIEAKVRDGTFPPPVRLSARRLAWLETDVARWQQERIAERDRKRVSK